MSGVLVAAAPRGRLVFGLAVAFVVLVLDQLSKWWIVDVFDMPSRRMVEVTSFFNLVMVWNRGVSFGLFANHAEVMPYVLAGVALAISAMLLVWLSRVQHGWMAVAIGMVIGGAIGNVIDRFRFGAVADFLDFHVAGWHWPAFNIADTGITVGVLMILADGLFGGHDKDTDRR